VTLKLGWDLFLLGGAGAITMRLHFMLNAKPRPQNACNQPEMKELFNIIFSLNICLDFQSQNLQNLQNLQKFILGYQVYP
jgi:hypothetical protein